MGRVDPDRSRERFVLPQRHQRAAHPRPDEGQAEQIGRHDRGQHQVVVRALGAQGPRGEPGQRDLHRRHARDAERPVGQVHPVHAHQRDAAREGDGQQHEVGAAQLEREPADDVARHAGQRDGGQEAEPGRPLELHGQQGRGVGADPEEGGVAERELPGVAEQEVQAEREHREDAGHDQRVQVIRVPHPGGRASPPTTRPMPSAGRLIPRARRGRTDPRVAAAAPRRSSGSRPRRDSRRRCSPRPAPRRCRARARPARRRRSSPGRPG